MPPFSPFETMQLFGLRPPRILTIAITGTCNLTCRHCWVSAGGQGSAGHIPQPTLLQIIDDYSVMGGRAIRFSGGEPLCYPGWLDVLRYAVDRGVQSLFLQTNGMLLTARAAAALRALPCEELSIQISLDGATATTHDCVRGEGAFVAALAGLDCLVRSGLGPHVSIFCTEMQHNLAEIPDLLELATARGLGSVVTGTLVRCGRAGQDSGVYPPAPEQYLQLLQRYDQTTRFRDLYELIGSVAAIEWSRSQTVRQACCNLAENPYLTAEGRLYPCLLCHADPFAVTAVFEKGLAHALLEAAPLWARLQKISNCRSEGLPGCRECPAQSCCAGGCMGRAWGSHGDLMAADDRCQVRRSIYLRAIGMNTVPLAVP